MSKLENDEQACTGVSDEVAPPLLLPKRPVVKAKPLARVGRKATGLSETAGLPAGRLKPSACRSGGAMSREARSVRSQGNRHGFWGSLVRAATTSLVVVLFITLSFTSASAEKGKKAGVAPDLQEKIHKGSPSDRVRLVVILNGADPMDVAERVEELGGKAGRHLRNVDEMVLVLPLGSVPDLADIEGLEYIAPDREVRGLASHVEVTTGASQVYGAQGGILGSLLSQRSEEHTSELQSPCNLVCRLLLEKKKK